MLKHNNGIHHYRTRLPRLVVYTRRRESRDTAVICADAPNTLFNDAITSAFRETKHAVVAIFLEVNLHRGCTHKSVAP